MPRIAFETGSHWERLMDKSHLRGVNIERKWLVLVAIGTGTYMSALDGSVVNTVLPVITATTAA